MGTHWSSTICLARFKAFSTPFDIGLSGYNCIRSSPFEWRPAPGRVPACVAELFYSEQGSPRDIDAVPAACGNGNNVLAGSEIVGELNAPGRDFFLCHGIVPNDDF